ncbi:MAG: response regulator [bacterium]
MQNIFETNSEYVAETKPRVLIIEDDPEFSYYLKIIFEDCGCSTMIASDGIKGYKAIKSFEPDLITLDLLLPNKTGIQLFRQLRKHSKFHSIPIIVITSYSENNYPMLDIKKKLYSSKIIPPEAFFEKPVESRELLLAVQRILGFTNYKTRRTGL